jgi:CPA2 family monovalent cation:H+ antiporter-2
MGFKVYYGDATRLELLKPQVANESFIAAIDNPTVNLQVIEVLKNTSQI